MLKAWKFAAALLILLMFFTVLDTANWYASPDSFHTEQSGSVSSLLPDGNRLDTSGLPAVRSLIIRFAVPLAEDTEAYLSCSRDGESELSTKKTVCPAGSAEITFSIPQSAYQYIDLHMDTPAEIAGAAVSDGAFIQVQSSYPFRPVNTLLPTGFLLLLAVLFLRIPPLRRFLLLLDRKVLSPETRWKSITAGYIIFTLAVVMQHVYVTLYQKTVATAASTLSIPLIIFAIVSILLGKLWKDRVFWIFFFLFCLKLLSTALQATIDFSLENDTFVLAAYAFFGAYAVARAIPRDSWKNALYAFCLLWTLAAAVYAVLGLYTAITGNPVQNLGTESFHILDNRLYPIYHPVTGGIVLSTSMAVTFIGFALAKRKPVKVFYVTAAVLFFLAGSPTGARTAYVLTGVELALLLALAAYDRLKPGHPDGIVRSLGKYILLILLAATVTGVVAFIQSYTFEAFRRVSTQSSLLSAALAESSVPTNELTFRGFVISTNPDATFNGRITIWKYVLKVVLDNPKNLFLGQSVHEPMRLVNEQVSLVLYEVNHCHNTLLQTLLENGLPGFLLYLSFIIILVFHSLQVLQNRSLPIWQRLLPVPALACLIGDLMDCTCHVTFGFPPMTLMFLFAGFTIALGRETKKRRKKGSLSETAAL